MSAAYSHLETADLIALTKQEQRNLTILLQQQAMYGPLDAPLRIVNGLGTIQRNMQALIDELRARGVRITGPERIALPLTACPFKGLDTFTSEDSDLFFGRESEVAQLIGLLRGHFFAAVVGPSGVGKSSLVLAGLLPALKDQRELIDGTRPPPDATGWRIEILRPALDPLGELAANLFPKASAAETAALIKTLCADSRTLRRMAAKILSSGAAQRPTGLLLIVDQFEELWTACDSETDRDAFISNLLLAAGPRSGGPVRILITVRSDFEDDWQRYPALQAALEQAELELGAMSEEALRRAIEEPAARANLSFAPGVVDVIVGEVRGDPDALPLLSKALVETWKLRTDSILTLEGYFKAGGVRGAISQSADALFVHDLGPEQQRIAQQICFRLIGFSEATRATRRRTVVDELITQAADPEAVKSVLKRLIAARLIKAGDDDTIEFTHDALISDWKRLQQWLIENRPSLLIQHTLIESTHRWLRSQRNPADLLRGPSLAQTRAWAAAHADQINHNEAAFLAVSTAHQRRALLWRIAGIGSGVALLVLALMLGVFPRLRQRGLKDDALRAGVLIDLPGGDMVFGAAVSELNHFERPQQTVRVESFRLERTEVTNRQYGWCLDAGHCKTPPADRGFAAPERADLPVVKVNAFQAAEYCAWLGRRLPTDLEWERAARGLTGRPWPWSAQAEPEPDRAHMSSNVVEPTGPLPVGQLAAGASPEGVFDLAGNVWEVVATTVTECPAGTCSAPWNGRDNAALVGRGGGWDGQISRITQVLNISAETQSQSVGFRCAQSIQP